MLDVLNKGLWYGKYFKYKPEVCLIKYFRAVHQHFSAAHLQVHSSSGYTAELCSSLLIIQFSITILPNSAIVQAVNVICNTPTMQYNTELYPNSRNYSIRVHSIRVHLQSSNMHQYTNSPVLYISILTVQYYTSVYLQSSNKHQYSTARVPFRVVSPPPDPCI